jgi:peptidoglycan/xylan/chitin deacetylase (PgdA/CDA1 family)
MATCADKFWGLSERLFLTWLAEKLQRPTGWSVLWGHGICAREFEMNAHDPRHVPVDVFRTQMKYLLSQGYTFITMSEGIKRLASGQRMERAVTLTFDDGFRNVVELAYPVMRELGLKGCLYVITDYVETNRVLWTDMVDVVCWYHLQQCRPLTLHLPEGDQTFQLRDPGAAYQSLKAIKRQLRKLPETQRPSFFQQIEALFRDVPSQFVPSDFYFAAWDDLRALDPDILEIGSHTKSHPNLANVDEPARLLAEVSESKAILERQLNRKVEHFCYPAGSYSPAVIDEVRRAGYQSAVTIKHGKCRAGISPYELTRLNLPNTVPFLKARTSGLESAVRGVQRGLGVGQA